tara:strand:- start:39054 stop:39941 length:888 start_codon:yes stop_codon:yes gene_type:complete
MKKIICAFFLLKSSFLFSAQWIAKEELPYEVKTLVESFNFDYLTDEEKNHLKTHLTELDSLMMNLTSNDRFFLAKSSVYKWILKYPPQVNPPASFTLKQFTEKESSKKLSPFAKWLVLALKSDAIDIQRSANYQQYLNYRNRKNLPYDLMSLKKKVDLLRPWAYLFYRDNGEQVNLQLTKHQFTLLKDIIAQYKLYYRFKGNQLPPLNPKDLRLFSLNTGKAIKKSSSPLDESISELDVIIKKHRKAGIPIPTNDWQASKKDTWTPGDEKGEFLKPDPSYTPPKELPKPVNDWEE